MGKSTIRVIHCGNWRKEIIETISFINIFITKFFITVSITLYNRKRIRRLIMFHEILNGFQVTFTVSYRYIFNIIFYISKTVLFGKFLLVVYFISKFFILGPATRGVRNKCYAPLSISVFTKPTYFRIIPWFVVRTNSYNFWLDTLIHKVMDFISYCSFIYSHVSWECHHALNSDHIKLHNAERRYIPADDIIRNTTQSDVNLIGIWGLLNTSRTRKQVEQGVNMLTYKEVVCFYENHCFVCVFCRTINVRTDET